MSIAAAHLLEQALLLPTEARAELIEALLERAEPSPDFLDYQVGVVARRMENVRNGNSSVISAEEAHQRVLDSLKLRA